MGGLTANGFLQPYIDQVRPMVAQIDGSFRGYMERIIARLEVICEELREEEWAETRWKTDVNVVDGSQVIKQVPMNETWLLEVATLDAGGAATLAGVTVKENGRTRVAFTAAAVQQGYETANPGVIFYGGAEITVNAVDGDPLAYLYLQFKRRIKVAPRSVAAGDINYGPDKPNDEQEMVVRHSTPAIFEGEPVRGERHQDRNAPDFLP